MQCHYQQITGMHIDKPASFTIQIENIMNGGNAVEISSNSTDRKDTFVSPETKNVFSEIQKK